MKSTLYLLPLLILSISVSMTSCTNRKGTQATKTSSSRIPKTNKVAASTIKKEEKSSNNSNTLKSEEKASFKKPISENGTNVKYVALPPINVDKIFKADYPKASNIFWAKENETTPNYKVTFSLAEKNNLLRYTQKGEIIETRSEILPEQLPPTVLNSIMTQYADAKISYVYTYKSTANDGAYIVWIQTDGKEKEILLLENGSFVK